MKSELSRELSKIKGFDNPKISLEQYITPPQLAADMLHTAYMNNDIEGRKIADLGSGTGIFSIGAALLNGEVTGFEKDQEAIKIAEENAENLRVGNAVEFKKIDIENVEETFNTVFMNPPFSVHTDSGISFLRKAVNISDNVYTVSHPNARQAIKDFVKKSNHRITAIEDYEIILPPTYGFHTEEGRKTKVDVIITRKED